MRLSLMLDSFCLALEDIAKAKSPHKRKACMTDK